MKLLPMFYSILLLVTIATGLSSITPDACGCHMLIGNIGGNAVVLCSANSTCPPPVYDPLSELPPEITCTIFTEDDIQVCACQGEGAWNELCNCYGYRQKVAGIWKFKCGGVDNCNDPDKTCTKALLPPPGTSIRLCSCK